MLGDEWRGTPLGSFKSQVCKQPAQIRLSMARATPSAPSTTEAEATTQNVLVFELNRNDCQSYFDNGPLRVKSRIYREMVSG
jgi:hypothetical protein